MVCSSLNRIKNQVKTVETVEETATEVTETTPEIRYFSEEDLHAKTRNELYLLAGKYEIDMSPVKKKGKAEIVSFLVGKIPSESGVRG